MEARSHIDHDRVTLPEALKEAGYDTAFLGKWHLMPKGQPNFKEHYPTNHGFDINRVLLFAPTRIGWHEATVEVSWRRAGSNAQWVNKHFYAHGTGVE